MRNLKKFLALVLAMMMVLGLMITANATDFTDDDAIADQYREAAEVLSTIGLFEGNNGNFDPKSNIRRAEFSILLYRMGTGDVTGKWAALGAQADQFTDVITGDNINFGWAAPYVNYAASMTWFQGDSGVGGTFRPGDPVSYHEVLVCMLRVLGLAEGTDGPDWPFVAADRASRLGLVEGIDSLVGYATREEVAQLIMNTLVYTTETGYIWTVYIDDGKLAADASAGEAARGNNRYDAGKDTLLYQGPDYDRAMLYAQSANAIVDSKRNTAGSLADSNFNGLTRTEDTDQYKRHTIVWTDKNHTEDNPVAEFAVEPDFYYNGNFTLREKEALDKAVGAANINVWYNGMEAKSLGYWQNANPNNGRTGLWYGTASSTSIGLPGVEIYVYLNDDKTVDVAAREAIIAQVTTAVDEDGDLTVTAYEATSSNAVAGIDIDVNVDSGSTLVYYKSDVYNPLTTCAANDVVAMYMTPNWASNTDDSGKVKAENIIGVEKPTSVTTTINHVRDNGMNINSTLETAYQTDAYPVANKALWTNKGGAESDGSAFTAGTVFIPGFNNGRQGRHIDAGTAILYILNDTALFIDQTKGATTSEAHYAYLWDTINIQDNNWKTEQDAATHMGKLYLDGSNTITTDYVSYLDPSTGKAYTTGGIHAATDTAFNVDEGGILVQYTYKKATDTAPAYYQISLPADNTNGSYKPNRGKISTLPGDDVAVQTGVAQGKLIDASNGNVIDVVYDDATVFYVVTTVPSNAGSASKYEVVKAYTGVRNVPTMYLSNKTETQYVIDRSKGITNLVRSVVIKNPGDGVVTKLEGTYFIVGDTSDDPNNPLGVTYHTVYIDDVKFDYYGYKAVVGNSGEVTEVWVNQKIDATDGRTYTLIGQDLDNIGLDAKALSAGYYVLDTSNGSIGWTKGNDATPASATNGSVDNTIFDKVSNLKTGDYNNGVISFDGSQGTSYMVTDIPIYLYNTAKGSMEKIDASKLKNGMTGYCVIEKDSKGQNTNKMVALYVTNNS